MPPTVNWVMKVKPTMDQPKKNGRGVPEGVLKSDPFRIKQVIL